MHSECIFFCVQEDDRQFKLMWKKISPLIKKLIDCVISSAAYLSGLEEGPRDFISLTAKLYIHLMWEKNNWENKFAKITEYVIVLVRNFVECVQYDEKNFYDFLFGLIFLWFLILLIKI